MCLTLRLRTAALILLLAAQSDADLLPVTVYVDHSDGGKTSSRHMQNLLTALGEEGCRAVVHDASSEAPAQLLFDSRPASIVNSERSDYRLIARAKTLQGELTVRGAILVHASTGIEDLSPLKGEIIAFVSKDSWPGYRLPVELLREAGVTEEPEKFHIVGNHIGAVSMLKHSDSFAAVVAEPLARRWAEANFLSIVAVTDEVETGGWWMLRTLPEGQVQQCASALSRLDRPRHKALPAWIDGFLISTESTGNY